MRRTRESKSRHASCIAAVHQRLRRRRCTGVRSRPFRLTSLVDWNPPRKWGSSGNAGWDGLGPPEAAPVASGSLRTPPFVSPLGRRDGGRGMAGPSVRSAPGGLDRRGSRWYSRTTRAEPARLFTRPLGPCERDDVSLGRVAPTKNHAIAGHVIPAATRNDVYRCGRCLLSAHGFPYKWLRKFVIQVRQLAHDLSPFPAEHKQGERGTGAELEPVLVTQSFKVILEPVKGCPVGGR